MNRRQLIKGALAGLAAPGGVKAAMATASWDPPAVDCVFYDTRFAEARPLAASLWKGARLTAVHGDVTPIWNQRLRRDPCSLALSGVTTESFHFCLETLLGERRRLVTHATRIGRDLFAWSIRCGPPLSAGRAS